MIKVQGFNDISKMVASLESFLRNDVEQIKTTKPFIKDFRQQEIPEILKTAGENIQAPFRDKKNKEWKKYRKFAVPTGWYKGIWSGETYYALWTGKSTTNIGIHQVVEPGYVEYGYDTDNDSSKYINFNLGLSDNFYNEQQNKYYERALKMIEKKIELINMAKYNEKIMNRE